MEIISLAGGLIGLLGGLCATIITLLVFIGLGIFLYKRSQQGKAAKDAAQAWPGTMGTVLMSTVQSRRTGNSTSTYPVVMYQYEVNGKSYQNQRIKAGEQFLNVRIMGEAHATANRYPVGTQVMVYYNPVNPQESALER